MIHSFRFVGSDTPKSKSGYRSKKKRKRASCAPSKHPTDRFNAECHQHLVDRRNIGTGGGGGGEDDGGGSAKHQNQYFNATVLTLGGRGIE